MAAHRDRLTIECLRRWCGVTLEELSPLRAFEIAAKLRNLAVWWLRPEVLELAAQHAEFIGSGQMAAPWRTTPPLPRDCGSCWIAVVIDPHSNMPLLPPAVPMVLRWAKGEPDDPMLPTGLIGLADNVREALRGDAWLPDDTSAAWGLRAARDTGLDLSKLESKWNSAWAPLAAGLLLAAAEGTPDPKVWASGGWTARRGIQPVEGLGAKTALARRFGANSFFLPETQLADAQSREAGGMELGPLLEGHNRPRDALRDYLDRLDIEPGRDASPDKRRDRFLRLVDNARARRYYEDNILDDVIERCRLQLPPQLKERCPRTLVTIVSKGYNVAVLTARLLQPDLCLLLHDDEMADVAANLAADLDKAGIIGGSGQACRVEKRCFVVDSREGLIATFRRMMEGVMASLPSARLVIDLTPGQGIMKLALYDAMPAGNYAFCIQPEHDGRAGRFKPFSEKVHCWSVTRTQSPRHDDSH